MKLHSLTRRTMAVALATLYAVVVAGPRASAQSADWTEVVWRDPQVRYLLADMTAGGRTELVGKNKRAFAAEQWLRADGDARDAAAARGGGCDDYGCVARAIDGRLVAVIATRDAFIEDCAQVAIIVTPLRAPEGCAAPVVIDRRRLAETGALTGRFVGERIVWTAARKQGESRPWSGNVATTPRAPPAPMEADEAEAAPVETADF